MFKEQIAKDQKEQEESAQNSYIVSNLYRIETKLASSNQRARYWQEVNKNRAQSYNMRVDETRNRNPNILQNSYIPSQPFENQPEPGS